VGLFDAVAPHRIAAGVIGGDTICEVGPPRRSPVLTALKHALDRVGAAVLLLVAAPLVCALAVVIRLDSSGPAIFRQTRVGRHGTPFTVYKLRTMRSDAEQVKHHLMDENDHDGVLFKMRHDPRITRVGYYLRRSSLDELPQLVNVLRGEMSLIGPRPFLPSETAEMSSDHLRRLAVRPGITGLWQVNGRADLGWDESVALDTYYVDNWTLGGDAQIALRTVDAVLRRRGAY
jgi:lipopolysaccharide/colanic/teichoic acid biosynthesis glycosyltransferase